MNNITTHPTPSFTVLTPDRSIPKGFKHAFLSRQIIDYTNPPATIRAQNGQIYQTVYEGVEDRQNKKLIEVIISFQSYTYGNFAIIRNSRPRIQAVRS